MCVFTVSYLIYASRAVKLVWKSIQAVQNDGTHSHHKRHDDMQMLKKLISVSVLLLIYFVIKTGLTVYLSLLSYRNDALLYEWHIWRTIDMCIEFASLCIVYHLYSGGVKRLITQYGNKPCCIRRCPTQRMHSSHQTEKALAMQQRQSTATKHKQHRQIPSRSVLEVSKQAHLERSFAATDAQATSTTTQQHAPVLPMRMASTSQLTSTRYRYSESDLFEHQHPMARTTISRLPSVNQLELPNINVHQLKRCHSESEESTNSAKPQRLSRFSSFQSYQNNKDVDSPLPDQEADEDGYDNDEVIDVVHRHSSLNITLDATHNANDVSPAPSPAVSPQHGAPSSHGNVSAHPPIIKLS